MIDYLLINDLKLLGHLAAGRLSLQLDSASVSHRPVKCYIQTSDDENLLVKFQIILERDIVAKSFILRLVHLGAYALIKKLKKHFLLKYWP